MSIAALLRETLESHEVDALTVSEHGSLIMACESARVVLVDYDDEPVRVHEVEAGFVVEGLTHAVTISDSEGVEVIEMASEEVDEATEGEVEVLKDVRRILKTPMDGWKVGPKPKLYKQYSLGSIAKDVGKDEKRWPRWLRKAFDDGWADSEPGGRKLKATSKMHALDVAYVAGFNDHTLEESLDEARVKDTLGKFHVVLPLQSKKEELDDILMLNTDAYSLGLTAIGMSQGPRKFGIAGVYKKGDANKAEAHARSLIASQSESVSEAVDISKRRIDTTDALVMRLAKAGGGTDFADINATLEPLNGSGGQSGWVEVRGRKYSIFVDASGYNYARYLSMPMLVSVAKKIKPRQLDGVSIRKGRFPHPMNALVRDLADHPDPHTVSESEDSSMTDYQALDEASLLGRIRAAATKFFKKHRDGNKVTVDYAKGSAMLGKPPWYVLTPDGEEHAFKSLAAVDRFVAKGKWKVQQYAHWGAGGGEPMSREDAESINEATLLLAGFPRINESEETSHMTTQTAEVLLGEEDEDVVELVLGDGTVLDSIALNDPTATPNGAVDADEAAAILCDRATLVYKFDEADDEDEEAVSIDEFEEFEHGLIADLRDTLGDLMQTHGGAERVLHDVRLFDEAIDECDFEAAIARAEAIAATLGEDALDEFKRLRGSALAKFRKSSKRQTPDEKKRNRLARRKRKADPSIARKAKKYRKRFKRFLRNSTDGDGGPIIREGDEDEVEVLEHTLPDHLEERYGSMAYAKSYKGKASSDDALKHAAMGFFGGTFGRHSAFAGLSGKMSAVGYTGVKEATDSRLLGVLSRLVREGVLEYEEGLGFSACTDHEVWEMDDDFEVDEALDPTGGARVVVRRAQGDGGGGQSPGVEVVIVGSDGRETWETDSKGHNDNYVADSDPARATKLAALKQRAQAVIKNLSVTP